MSDWFFCAPGAPVQAPLVFCFAHAGGNPRTFLAWQPALAEDATLVAVQAPEPAKNVEQLCDRAAEAIDRTASRPFLLFGHSMGALLAFEVARRLDDRPEHLVASGCAAPRLLPTPRVVTAAKLEGRAFAEAVDFFGGLPPEILADENLQDLLLPGVQADFRLVAGYRYRPAALLRCGVSLINGKEDPHLRDGLVREWAAECRDEPEYHWADGGHFYLTQRPEAVTDVLRSLVRAHAGHAQHVRLI